MSRIVAMLMEPRVVTIGLRAMSTLISLPSLRLAVTRRQQVVDGKAVELCLRVAEKRLGERVGIEDPACGVDDDRRVGHGVQQPETVFIERGDVH
jgi:hypothetical protein